jgi:hypothetical protein
MITLHRHLRLAATGVISHVRVLTIDDDNDTALLDTMKLGCGQQRGQRIEGCQTSDFQYDLILWIL